MLGLDYHPRNRVMWNEPMRVRQGDDPVVWMYSLVNQNVHPSDWIDRETAVIAPARGGMCLGARAVEDRSFALRQCSKWIARQTTCISNSWIHGIGGR